MEALTVLSSEKEWVIKIDKTQPLSKELLLEMSILLYKRELISLGKAANLAGIHRIEFQEELDNRKIDIHYSIAEFDEQMLQVLTIAGE